MGNWLCGGIEDERSPEHLSFEVSTPPLEHKSTLIFLHGLGDSGLNWVPILRKLVPPHCKVVCPNAKPIPVVINNRYVMPAWYDIYGLTPDSPQDEAGIHDSVKELSRFVKIETDAGIPLKKIVVGGFSQGGSVALYYCLTSGATIGGVLALSCWLPMHEYLTKNVLSVHAPTDLPILQCHGLADQLIPFTIGDLTNKFLKHHFHMRNCILRTFHGLGHSYNEEELQSVKTFLQENLCS